MATAAQITAETYWQREIVGPNLKAFGTRCRAHFAVDALAFGTAGNVAHLTGRHRSLEWVLYSAFCTRRSYGTVDKRDTAGNPRLIRAFDLTLPAAVLHEVSRNVEAACRDGSAYMLAEYYGDMGDDSLVDGWYEGRDSTSDSSHKRHLHGGLWTIYADDAQALDDLFNIMTGGTAMADMTKDLHYATFEDADAETRQPQSLAGILHSIQTAVTELAERETPAPVTIPDEQLERVMRKVLGMAPAS